MRSETALTSYRIGTCLVADRAVSARLPLFVQGSHAIVVARIGVQRQHAPIG
jgi:hypothetical protein